MKKLFSLLLVAMLSLSVWADVAALIDYILGGNW